MHAITKNSVNRIERLEYLIAVGERGHGRNTWGHPDGSTEKEEKFRGREFRPETRQTAIIQYRLFFIMIRHSQNEAGMKMSQWHPMEVQQNHDTLSLLAKKFALEGAGLTIALPKNYRLA